MYRQSYSLVLAQLSPFLFPTILALFSEQIWPSGSVSSGSAEESSMCSYQFLKSQEIYIFRRVG